LAGGYNPNKVFRELHESGIGLKGIYNGIELALLARTANLFIRNTLYKVIYDRVKPVKVTNDLTHREKATLAGFVGGVSTLITNPLDVLVTRA